MGGQCGLMTSLRGLVLYFLFFGDWDSLLSKITWPHGRERTSERIWGDDRKEEGGKGCWVGKCPRLSAPVLTLECKFSAIAKPSNSLFHSHICTHIGADAGFPSMCKDVLPPSSLNLYFFPQTNFSIKPQYTQIMVVYCLNSIPTCLILGIYRDLTLLITFWQINAMPWGFYFLYSLFLQSLF